MSHSTDHVFKRAMQPLLNKVLQGIDSIFIVYGQSGSGKSFTLIGEANQFGLLPQAFQYLLQQDKVKQIDMRCVEAYGKRVQRIEFYDLVKFLNEKKKNKKNKKKFDIYKCSGQKSKPEYMKITNDNCFNIISQLQEVSHMAPTLKNPHSSRGHTVYICRISIRGMENVRFIAVDLAGSEGNTALGTRDEFMKGLKLAAKKGKLKIKLSQTQIHNCVDQMYQTRFLEAACIKDGLTQLQSVFEQLIQKKLQKAQGTGVRKILDKYISLQSAYAVLFTLSASVTNADATKSTLKFAKRTQLVKVDVKRAKLKIDKDAIIQQLRRKIEELDAKLMAKTSRSEGKDDDASSIAADMEQLTRKLSQAAVEEEQWSYNYNIRSIFNQFDVDGNGSIDCQELQNAFACGGYRMSSDDINKLIDEYDTDRNGKIEFDEFKVMITESPVVNDFENKLKARMENMMSNMEWLTIPNLHDDDDEKHDDQYDHEMHEIHEYDHIDNEKKQQATIACDHIVQIDKLENEIKRLKVQNDKLNGELQKALNTKLKTRHTLIPDPTPLQPELSRDELNVFLEEMNEVLEVVQSHYDFIRNRDDYVNEEIQINNMSQMLKKAKRKALEYEKELLREILTLRGMQNFFDNIILVENAFNSAYQESNREQQAKARQFAERKTNILEYEEKKKPTSDVDNFQQLLLAQIPLNRDPFEQWLCMVVDKCKKEGIVIVNEPKVLSKGIERTFYKTFYVYRKSEKSFQHITDILRCTFVFNDFQHLYECFAVIERLSAEHGGILRVKDRFNEKKMDFGYRDLLINIHCPNERKFICEVQLQHEIFYRYKKVSHAIYKKARLFEQDDNTNLAYIYASKHSRDYIGKRVYEFGDNETSGASYSRPLSFRITPQSVPQKYEFPK